MQLRVSPSAGDDRWVAWDGDQAIGDMGSWRGPDGRHRLYFGTCRADAYAVLAEVISGTCYAEIAIDDAAAGAALRAAGFTDHRVEAIYRVPVAVLDAPVPDGISVVTADKCELEPLMMLDCAIRADIPGAEGWQPDSVWFREETYDSPLFDPQTYRVALAGSAYVGLARVWRTVPGASVQRLGCVGVLASWRRRGLARALIGAAFTPLVSRGVREVQCEIDATNQASRGLFADLGAVACDARIELRRSGVSAR
jgi:ribosomal protein S18 acetylase RimI-like enzyme